MTDLQKRMPVPTLPLATPAVQHDEPKEGGSFTRNVDTGGLTKSEPVPANKTEQE